MGTTPATNGSSSQGTTSQGVNRPSWQGLQIHKSGTLCTHSYVQTNKHMYHWILLDSCSPINLFCNDPMSTMCTELTLHYPSQQCRSNDNQPQGRIAWLQHHMIRSSSHDKCATFQQQHSQTVSHLRPTRI